MALTVGTRLGPYEIRDQIGAGGMGEVYRATDTLLDRTVAIKVLPEHLADDPQRRERFEREARAVSSLNHPHICTLHDVGEQDGIHYLVMEYVEGDTLQQRLGKGRLPLDQALEYAIQIADALDKAHRQGVVHRDLKPGNIMITKSGTKLLDFGLAKLKGDAGEVSPLSQMPTQDPSAPLTAEGTILGTLQYMAPEQLEGKEADARTDIFAFGAVVYEMVTGKKAFEGTSQASLIHAIMGVDPPSMAELQVMTPRAVDHVVKRCFAKDPDERWQSTGDLMHELRWTAAVGGDEGIPIAGPSASASRQLNVWRSVAAILFIAVLAITMFRPVAPDVAQDVFVSRTTMSLPEGQRQSWGMAAPIAISPDGTTVAYIARDESGSHLFIRPIDKYEARKMPGTEFASVPFFSPDSQWVGFFAAGSLKKIPVVGGSPSTITGDVHGAVGASWGPDDMIVFSPNVGAGLWQVSANSGRPERLTEPYGGELGFAHVWPQHLPGGDQILFTMWAFESGVIGPHVLDLRTRQFQRIHDSTSSGYMYLSSGHLLYPERWDGGGLLAAPFDLDRLAVSGSPFLVLNDVRYWPASTARSFIAVSQTGTAVYVSDELDEATLMWVDRDSDTTPITNLEGVLAEVRLSPDARTVAYDDRQGAVWTLDIGRGSPELLISETPDATSSHPIWSGNESVIFSSTRAGSWDFYEMDVATRGEPQPLLIRDSDQFAISQSADGTLTAYQEVSVDTGIDIWFLPDNEDPVPIRVTDANEFAAMLSPDGRLLAYVSDLTEKHQVYVMSYPELEVRTVSIDGGDEPMWSKDGRELFFRYGDALFSATVTAEPVLEISPPSQVFEMAFDRSTFPYLAYYDVSTEGDRFLVVSERSTMEFKVIQNWFEELNRLAPTDNEQ